MKTHAQPSTVTSWDQLPLICGVPEFMALSGLSARAIERYVRLGRRFPQPILTHPMRWSRDDLRRFVEGERNVAGHVKTRRLA